MHRPHAKAAVIAQPAPQSKQTVFWIIAILLAIIATALIVGQPGSTLIQPANAQNSSMVGARGIFAFTGQLDEDSYGLFMLDVDSNNVWVYQYQPNDSRLKLVAARSFLYDRYLEDYKNAAPGPQEIKRMLDDQRRIQSRVKNGGVAGANNGGVIYTDVPGAVELFEDGGKKNDDSDRREMRMTPAG